MGVSGYAPGTEKEPQGHQSRHKKKRSIALILLIDTLVYRPSEQVGARLLD
ncbi:MAG: hypothetical protein KF876_04715 [Nitrospira sp.]|nr:hypothetical protein [Nitrospira sp.]MBX3333401.1 hypothetical protein [Nitrospira sp.]